MTNNNLFKAYHERQFLELANKDSKLIMAYFDLTALDIHQLDFRDTILIDQTYYRLNRVMDYNPFKAGLTKVELFKAGDIAWASPSAVGIGTGQGLGVGKLKERTPATPVKTLSNGNQFEPFQGKVTGTGNVVSPNAVGFFVQGDGNTVGASKNVTLIGSGNTVANGVKNVTAIGVSGRTITESNTVINGAGGVQTAKLLIPTAEVLTLNTIPKALGLTVPAGFYVQPLSIGFLSIYGTTPYATNVSLRIRPTGSSSFIAAQTINYAVDTFTNMAFSGGTADQLIDATDFEVFVNTGNPTAGDSDITIYLTYILVAL